jgi:hypothetical protein
MSHLIKWAGVLMVVTLFSLPVFAQEIQGTVKDSTGSGLPYVSINLKSKPAGVIVAYTTTGPKGAYVLRLPANAPAGDCYLEASSIGYKTQSKALTGLPAPIDFVLAVSANELEAVVVRNKRPMLRTNGDTASYKVSDFSTSQDRVIGDIIKRLPGIAVSADGTITYNNKPISGIYIGGDNLLDDKYSIAANTIPNGVIDQVQVIDNHQPIKVLQNKVASNEVAINLTLKDKARLHLMGQEMVEAGLPGNYNAELNALLFNDQYKAINYLKVNNTGEDLQQELVSHNTSASQQRIGNNLPTTLLSLGAVNNPDLSRQRYLFNHTGLLNINDLVNLKNGTQLRLNAYYLQDKQQQDYSQRTSVFLLEDTIQYTELQHNQFNPALLHAQFTVNKNKEKYYHNNVLTLHDSRPVNYSTLNTNGTPVNQVFRDHSLTFSNEFNMIRSLRSNKIIEGYAYISHFAEPEVRTIEPSYNAALFNQGKPYAQLIQNVNVPTWFTNNYISLKMPGNNFTQSFKTGFSVQSQTLTAALNVLQSNNTVSLASDSALNHVHWSNKKYYAEAAYDIPAGKLKGNLTLPLTFQQLNYSDTGYALKKELARLYVDPQLSIKYQIGIENFVTLLYNYRHEAGNIDDIYQGDMLKDYRTLYANTADLTLRQNQLAAVGFTYRKALKLFFFSINIAYNHIGANNIAASTLSNNLQKRIVLPYPNSTNAWTATGSISKYSFGLHTTFSAGLQWQERHAVQFQNNTLLPFYTTSERVTLSAETKVSKQLNFSYVVTGIQTNSHSPAAVAANHIRQLMQQAAIYYNPTAILQFKLSGEHYFTSRQDNPDLSYFFADVAAKYRIKKWNIDLQLAATNVLNVKNYNALYLSVNTLIASSYTLPGRIILLKALFNL